jgi:hypothetical protein
MVTETTPPGIGEPDSGSKNAGTRHLGDHSRTRGVRDVSTLFTIVGFPSLKSRGRD